MKLHSVLALLALSGPALASDLVVTREKHSDAATIMNQEQPAKDSKEVLWVGDGRMRVEDGSSVTIVRSDLKKVWFLDTAAKTVSTMDLPFDLKKYVPAEVLPMMEQMQAQVKVTLTPGTETRKVDQWNTTKYTLTMTMPMGSMTTDMWVTKDIAVDASSLNAMSAELLAASPMGSSIANEMKKIDGVPVLVERVQKVMGTNLKSTEKVVSVEQKEPEPGLYDIPPGYTEKPYDPMAGMNMGGGGPGGHARPR